MAWCLKSLCEQYSKVKNVDDFTEKLQELAYLRLDEIGIDDMANRFTWDIKILFELLMNEPDILLETAERILTIIPNLNFQRPHKYYSLLADTFMRVKGRQNTAWLHFVDFMEWFCFDNFLPEDYERIHLKNGKSLPSIVERVYNAYYKALMAQIEAGNVHLQRIDDFIKRLTRLNEKHPEYQYTLYHKALLLLVLNKKTEALDSLRPFVKRKQNDFWVWDVLSETVDDSNLKLSCLCRALMCHTEPKFLGRIHLKAAHLMHALGFDGNARTEIRAINKTYQEQVVKNSKAMANKLMSLGAKLITNGTDNHLMLIDVYSSYNLTGLQAQMALEEVNITTNKNSIPNDTQRPMYASGIRLGSPAMTSRGFNEEEFIKIATLIDLRLKNPSDEKIKTSILKEIKELTSKHPLNV